MVPFTAISRNGKITAAVVFFAHGWTGSMRRLAGRGATLKSANSIAVLRHRHLVRGDRGWQQTGDGNAHWAKGTPALETRAPSLAAYRLGLVGQAGLMAWSHAAPSWEGTSPRAR